MQNGKPLNMKEYRHWLKETHGVDTSKKYATYYNAVALKVATDFPKKSIWQTVTSRLENISQQYYLKTGYDLFINKDMLSPEFFVKPFDSFLLKTFRKNVLYNDNWPDPPESAWLLPDNWYSCVNDIVRTCLVVKYLDGVNFFAEQLTELCNSSTVPCHVDYEAKEEGYYAAHFYLFLSFEIPREDWDTKEETISIEIQITTQLQEVIRKLLHKYYEQHRAETSVPDLKWQWNYQSDEFAANYLGHILHYVEGMIIDVRNKG